MVTAASTIYDEYMLLCSGYDITVKQANPQDARSDAETDLQKAACLQTTFWRNCLALKLHLLVAAGRHACYIQLSTC